MESSVQPALATPRKWLVLLIVFGSLGVLGLWTIATPPDVHSKADAVGYAICHRIEGRSFEAFGRTLPLCARCTGIYLGAMTSLAVYVASGRGKVTRLPHWKIGLVLLGFVGVLGVDGLNSYFHLFPDFDNELYEPNNTLRLITGMYCGLAFMTLVLPLFNNLMWYEESDVRLINNWRELAGLVLVITLVTLAVMTRRPLILLVGGLVSAAGVVIMLTMINSVMVAAVLGRERQHHAMSQLWLPLLGGMGISFILIGTIDYLRYTLTGTWSGFEFPESFIYLMLGGG